MGGVVGFHPAAVTTQVAQQPRTPEAAQLPNMAQAEPYENHHIQGAPEALTTESVEPCTRRGCTHFSWSGPLPSVLSLLPGAVVVNGVKSEQSARIMSSGGIPSRQCGS